MSPTLNLIGFNCATGEEYQVSRLAEPIIIRFTLLGSPGSASFSGMFFNKAIGEWSKTAITTTKDQDNVIVVKTSHLTTFSLMADPDGVNLVTSKPTYLLPLIVGGVLVLLLIISLIIDLVMGCRKHDIFPHLSNQKASSRFCSVFWYSFLYNFPVLSLFGNVSRQVLVVYKALWLSVAIWSILLVQLLAYTLWQGEDIVWDFQYIVGFSTGVLLLPNSLLYYFLLV